MFTAFRQEHFNMAFLALVAFASGGDIVADLSQGASRAHLLQEAALLTLALTTLAGLAREHRNTMLKLKELQTQLAEARALPASQSPGVSDARHQLGKAIIDQFGLWQLTTSEREVGLMLLKGFSLKEIALLRGTSERTIRQQASSVYQKAQVSGRHAFSAWFIEDLL
jgi:DNA-binding NarL/FixJ family response regulator